MKQLLFLFLLLIGSASQLQAQGKKQHDCLSPEEFRAKQQAYITEKAELNKEEAATFFPVYYELQDKKKKINDQVWNCIRQGKSPNITEKQYEGLIDQILDRRIEADELEKNYYQQFKKLLPASKLFKVQHAEIKFHREVLKGANKRHASANRK